jgi:hypothetical protein
MPLREGPEFLRGHLGHPSARMSLSPDTKGGFSLGLAGAGHSFTSACRLMTPDPKEARFSGQVPPVIPGAKRFPGGIGWGITGKPPLGYCVTFETAPPGATPGRRTECSAAGLG